MTGLAVQSILVIEDEPSIADAVAYALETEGFAAVRCATGREGTAALLKGGIALVILDVGLPDQNGFELCRKIRKTSAVPIIFLTARGEEVDRVVGLEIGGDDYVAKPFSPRELAARVKSVLRRSSQAGPPPGARPAKGRLPFVVDEERFQISYFNTALQLSRYEFRLLKVLASRPGRVFSRDQLMDLAWEEPGSSLDRTVDAHVKSLRRKLRAVRKTADPIRTHRGLGYSMRDDW
jgi:two-component system, OmpR family, catabolic regulation response regulator CreB